MDLGSRLRSRRESLGLTQAQVVERTGLGASTVSEIENSKREASLSQLNALATLYQTRLSDLFSDAAPAEPVVLWRKKPADAAPVAARFVSLCRQYQDLERWTGAPVVDELPHALREVRTQADAAALGAWAREKLGLGRRPARKLLSCLEEDVGVKVFFATFAEGTAACTAGEFGRAILLNLNNGRLRRNFDLAHELFHLVTWQQFRTEGNGETSDEEEKLANVFASSFLMPEEELRQAVAAHLVDGRLRLDAAYDIARDFDVSVPALLWRIHHVYKLDEAETKRMSAEATREAIALGQADDEKLPSRPLRFRSLAIQALRRGLISTGKCAEYLGIRRHDAMALVGDEGDADQALAIPHS